MKNNKSSQSGFTLIESIVGVAIFIVAVTALIGLFLQFSKLNRAGNAKLKTLSELSFVLDKIAQDVRVGEIIFDGLTVNYGGGLVSAYTHDGTENPDAIFGEEKELVLMVNNQLTIYVFDTPNDGKLVCGGQDGGGLFKYLGPAGPCEEIFQSSQINVLDAGFYIQPAHNPYPDSSSPFDCKVGSSFNGYFCTCAAAADCYSNVCDSTTLLCSRVNVQPRVTVFMRVEADAGDQTSPIFNIQTTATSRIYKR